MGEVIYLDIYREIRNLVKESGYVGLKPMKVYREQLNSVTDFLNGVKNAKPTNS